MGKALFLSISQGNVDSPGSGGPAQWRYRSSPPWNGADTQQTRRWPRRPPREPDTAGVVAPPPLIYLAGLVVGIVLDALLPEGSLPWVIRWVLGGVLVAAGLALLASFNTAFTRRGTAVEPWKPTTAIVTTGPYRITRDPAYLGMALLYVGITLLSDVPWALLPLPIVVVRHRPHGHRARGALPRAQVRQAYLDYKRRRAALDLSRAVL